MTTTHKTMTLAEMQQSDARTLRRMATEGFGNRFVSMAADMMANAMDAHAIGDSKMVAVYVERAKVAMKRSQEDERGQLRRVREHMAITGEKPVAEGQRKMVASNPVSTVFTTVWNHADQYCR